MEYYWHENNVKGITSDYSRELKGSIIHSADIRYLKAADATLLIQRLGNDHFSLWFCDFNIIQAGSLVIRSETPTISLRFMLERSIDRNEVLGEGLCAMVYAPADAGYALVLDQGNYRTVRVDLKPSFVAELRNASPHVQAVLTAFESGQDTCLYLPRLRMDFRIRTIIKEIRADSDRPVLGLLLHARIYELLWLYLAGVNKDEQPDELGIYFKKIQMISAYITDNLDLEIGTAYLSRQFHISGTTLKRQFKLQYGLTIRAFLLQQRMITAMHLLTHSDLSVHSIGAKTGYPEFSSFTRAFTKYHGNPPTFFRK